MDPVLIAMAKFYGEDQVIHQYEEKKRWSTGKKIALGAGLAAGLGGVGAFGRAVRNAYKAGPAMADAAVAAKAAQLAKEAPKAAAPIAAQLKEIGLLRQGKAWAARQELGGPYANRAALAKKLRAIRAVLPMRAAKW